MFEKSKLKLMLYVAVILLSFRIDGVFLKWGRSLPNPLINFSDLCITQSVHCFQINVLG